jgi:acyl-CoA thioesterase I
MSQAKHQLRRGFLIAAAATAVCAFGVARAEVTGLPGNVAVPAPSAAAQPTPPAVLPESNAAAAVQQTACGAPAEFTRLDYPLNHVARELARDKPIKIVAIGSSSTAGAGASSPAATYPSRLAVELSQRFPDNDVTVINRGVNGEETADMLARFETGVIAEHPDLVLWQVGTNSVLRDHPLGPHTAELHEGVTRLKETGADVVLIDPQFAPKVITKHDAQAMVDLISLAAKQENVDLFHRFAVMRYWRQVQNVAFDKFLSPDELHMNDWSYSCVAKLLGSAIAEAATRPVASAAAHAEH